MNQHLSGPVLVFGGPYSNLEALQAIRKEANRLQLGATNCICTGDVVAYCADAKETVNEIRDWGIQVVMGNCEEALAEDADDCGCGFESGTSCDLLSKQWFSYARAELNAEARKWMANLPRTIEFKLNNVLIQVLHGGVDQINRFIFASQPDDILEEMNKTNVDIIIAGHCGLPFAKSIDHRLWLNAGVIGMPANDAQENTWYCLLTPKKDGIEITFHCLQYKAISAAAKMRKKGLAEGYAKALETGLWPSLDILPESERNQTGLPIELSSVFHSGSTTL